MVVLIYNLMIDRSIDNIQRSLKLHIIKYHYDTLVDKLQNLLSVTNR